MRPGSEGAALVLVPLALLAMMAAGGALGSTGVALPFAQAATAVSVVALGFVLSLRPALSTLAAMTLVGAFAVFHGYAHGAKTPDPASGPAYAAGFVGASALLHAAGLGLALNRFGGGRTAPRFGWPGVESPWPASGCRPQRSGGRPGVGFAARASYLWKDAAPTGPARCT